MRSVSDLITIINTEREFIKDNMSDDHMGRYMDSIYHDIIIYLIELRNIGDIVNKWKIG